MTSKVVVALRVKASRERAFDVFTREIGLWWRPNDLFRFTAGPPGRMAFEPWLDGRLTETDPQGRWFEIGRITEWAPGERLAFTWRQANFAPDHLTEVEVSFEPIGDETRVTVEHRGWDQAPADHPRGTVFRRRRFSPATPNGGATCSKSFSRQAEGA